jgi:hypothetical protein
VKALIAIVALAGGVQLANCGTAQGETPPEAASTPKSEAPEETKLPKGWRVPQSDAEREAVQRIERGADDLLKTLMGRLTSAIGDAGGLGEAARVCATEAQLLTSGVAEKHGIAVGRTSVKLRNSSENRARPWVQPWLKEHADRKATDIDPVVGIVEQDGRTYARLIRPIGIQPLCLNCHGPEANIPAEVKAVLAQHYPDDAATGYAIGDLRGALWAEFEVPATAR